ncbi:YafY family transcriptional regulator [Pseudolysobacter antarcticus]|uniref:YafY family transcriptional regulator n=1 Tax=Pseudolysobacter antarcticus TaxID=2511995 RepID=A0A411HF12_9GAMM|nr:YafY family protein [Pseudolysobacter antarcticus]QBB69072.1 YafY family transcriptional regulator [Pseudolysobacter antarcticus]
MYHPTTRALTVLELLQTHGRLSGSELALRIGVDGRTLRRYISRLEDIGIPITAERGRYGAYMLIAGFKLPPMMFNNDEALALSVGLLAARSMGLANGIAAIESAQAKLERVMPSRVKAQPRALSATVSLDLALGVPIGDGNTLAILSGAAHARHRVHMRYLTPQNIASARDFDAYGLAWRAGRWYVIGWCHLRRALRSFRLDRMQDVRALDIAFERPKNFDAAAHLNFSIATVPRAFVVEVLLHTDLQTAVAEMNTSIGLFDVCDDGVLLRARTDSIDWFARQLASLPCNFDVRSPPELRAAVHAHAKRLLALSAR